MLLNFHIYKLFQYPNIPLTYGEKVAQNESAELKSSENLIAFVQNN